MRFNLNHPTNIFRGRTVPYYVRRLQIKQYPKSKDVELINCYMAIDLDCLLALEWYSSEVPTYPKKYFYYRLIMRIIIRTI